MKREGFWSIKRLTRLTEPLRPKVHWDYLCEEMQWLSADFAQERRWKRGVARKVRDSHRSFSFHTTWHPSKVESIMRRDWYYLLMA